MIINMNGAKAPETPSPVLQEKTVTPETLPTVIGADEGYDGLSQVTVNPDSQLKAENIRSGKTIFGVDGVFTGGATTGMSVELLDSFNNFLSFNPDTNYSWLKKGSITLETVEDAYEYNDVYKGEKITGGTNKQLYCTTMKSATNVPKYPKRFVYTLDDVSSLIGISFRFEKSFGKTTGSFTMQVRPGESLYNYVYASNNVYTLTGTCSLRDDTGSTSNNCTMTITSINQSYAINETWYCKYENETGGPYNVGLYIDWILVEADA